MMYFKKVETFKKAKHKQINSKSKTKMLIQNQTINIYIF